MDPSNSYALIGKLRLLACGCEADLELDNFTMQDKPIEAGEARVRSRRLVDDSLCQRDNTRAGRVILTLTEGGCVGKGRREVEMLGSNRRKLLRH